jgi:NitT/TauT family transport system ATP-binding protein
MIHSEQGNAGRMSGAGQTPRIVIRGAGKNFAGMKVFSDVNLTVGEREIITVVGPSGCGKTTLLRSIVGLNAYEEGDIEIDGIRVNNAPREGVGMVFQNFGLFPWKTVFDNVAYGLRLAGAPEEEIQRKVTEQIKLVKLTGFEKAYPYQLSGGMQQRCGLARALALEPSVLLLDEPFGAIDAQTREILQFELLRIWESRPIAMVFITHSIDEAVLMGDRVVILKGRPSSVFEIVDVGLQHPRTRATLSDPRFAEVREYVWSTVMQEAAAAEFHLHN